MHRNTVSNRSSAGPCHPWGHGRIGRFTRFFTVDILFFQDFRSRVQFQERSGGTSITCTMAKQEIPSWITPASACHNDINFNKNRKCLSNGQQLCQKTDINCGTQQVRVRKREPELTGIAGFSASFPGTRFPHLRRRSSLSYRPPWIPLLYMPNE